MPTEAFAQLVLANLNYWVERLERAGEADLRRLFVDHPNVQRAVQAGLAVPDALPAVTRLVTVAYPFIERGGYWPQWIGPVEEALQSSGAITSRTKTLLLDFLGQFQRLSGHGQAAIAAHLQAEAEANVLADAGLLAHIRFNLAEDYRLAEQYASAEAAGWAALTGFTQLGQNRRQRAAVLNTLGLIARARGQLPEAIERLREAVVLWREAEQPIELVRSLNNLGNALATNAQPEQGEACLKEALDILGQSPSLFEQAMVAISLGTLYFNHGRLEAAERTFRLADTPAFWRSPHSRYRALLANNLGNVLLHLGQLAAAESYLRQAGDLWRGLKATLMLANTVGTLAEVQARQGHAAEAMLCYAEALEHLAAHIGLPFADELRVKFEQQRAMLLGDGQHASEPDVRSA